MPRLCAVDFAEFLLKSYTSRVRLLKKSFHGAKTQVAIKAAVELTVEAHFEIGGLCLSSFLAFPDPKLTPVRGGHLADEEIVHFAFGMEGAVELIDESVKEPSGFAFEHDGFGEGSLAGAVTGGAGFAVWSYGPVRFCAAPLDMTKQSACCTAGSARNFFISSRHCAKCQT